MTTMQDGCAFTADIMDRVLAVRNTLGMASLSVNIRDNIQFDRMLTESGCLTLIRSIANDGYLHFSILIDGKNVLYIHPDNEKDEHEHMWYRIEFPAVMGIQVMVFAFVPPSEAWSPEDEDLPTCTVCKKTVPSQEIYYTGSDERDYCQHCYDYDKHGSSS